MNDSTSKSFFTPLTLAVTRLYRRVLKLFGISIIETTESIKILSDLCLAQTARRARYYEEKKLPGALLQAFSVEALAAGDARFIGRESQLERLTAAFEMWRAGHNSMIAVTGPQGCGLSSFLRQLEEVAGAGDRFRYHKLTRRPYDINDTLLMLSEFIGLEQAAVSTDELLERINKLPPSVFVIDNGHFLSCRVMGAHAAIRVFGALMVATQQRHLWVLGCEEFAWRRLNYIYHAERFFTDRIQLSMFNEQELDECLSLRQQVSGVVLNTVMESKNNDMQDALELPTLYKLSNGKPDFAFFYYLGALQVNPENKQLDMSRSVALDFSALKSLISEELFTLAEVVIHGRLTIDDHCALFRTSREQSWLLLERLYQQCLLDKDETADELGYRLVPVYSEVISRYLTNTNYLY
ncbi:MAG: AAA family ATPase [Gammaproteobacteria bacterium]|nr:AAA family ATPase [Gammaproteobacteria bacterium]